MKPDEIIDPPPACQHGPRLAGTGSGYMAANRRTWGASTHTHPHHHNDWKATNGLRRQGPHTFAARSRLTRTALGPRRQLGWSLALMCIAETIVAVAAITTTNRTIGLVTVSSMALAGLLLVVAEAVCVTREANR